jgi:RNA polymerase sigma factor (sigma-70 family)
MTPLLARPGPDRAFDRMYRRHVRDVYRYAYAVLHNRSDAEDVTQTTFLNAYRALERGERPRTPHNWLIAIAHNVCRHRFRQSERRPHEVGLEGEVAERLVEDEPGPSGADIRRALAELAFNQRAALVMRELEGRSYAEIADVLGLSVSAVETLIFRARRALREQLDGVLTCGEAELATSRQLDGRLSRAGKAQLRAHLRRCPDCAAFARRQRGQRAALKALAGVPLPASLASFLGGGGGAAAGAGAGAAGVGIVAKAAAVVAAATVAATAGYEGSRRVVAHHHRAPARPTPVAELSGVPAPGAARVPLRARPSTMRPRRQLVGVPISAVAPVGGSDRGSSERDGERASRAGEGGGGRHGRGDRAGGSASTDAGHGSLDVAAPGEPAPIPGEGHGRRLRGSARAPEAMPAQPDVTPQDGPDPAHERGDESSGKERASFSGEPRLH